MCHGNQRVGADSPHQSRLTTCVALASVSRSYLIRLHVQSQDFDVRSNVILKNWSGGKLSLGSVRRDLMLSHDPAADRALDSVDLLALRMQESRTRPEEPVRSRRLVAMLHNIVNGS